MVLSFNDLCLFAFFLTVLESEVGTKQISPKPVLFTGFVAKLYLTDLNIVELIRGKFFLLTAALKTVTSLN